MAILHLYSNSLLNLNSNSYGQHTLGHKWNNKAKIGNDRVRFGAVVKPTKKTLDRWTGS